MVAPVGSTAHLQQAGPGFDFLVDQSVSFLCRVKMITQCLCAFISGRPKRDSKGVCDFNVKLVNW